MFLELTVFSCETAFLVYFIVTERIKNKIYSTSISQFQVKYFLVNRKTRHKRYKTCYIAQKKVCSYLFGGKHSIIGMCHVTKPFGCEVDCGYHCHIRSPHMLEKVDNRIRSTQYLCTKHAYLRPTNSSNTGFSPVN